MGRGEDYVSAQITPMNSGLAIASYHWGVEIWLENRRVLRLETETGQEMTHRSFGDTSERSGRLTETREDVPLSHRRTT
jgi:hypothetical protein